jgi:hypothetical protein
MSSVGSTCRFAQTQVYKKTSDLEERLLELGLLLWLGERVVATRLLSNHLSSLGLTKSECPKVTERILPVVPAPHGKSLIS